MTGERPAGRAALEAVQLAALNALLEKILPANRFYAAKWAAAGAPARFANLSEFLARAPFTSKLELSADQAAHPPFGSALTEPLEAYTRFHQTSASTGQPLRWLDTPEGWQWMLDNWSEVYRAAGVARADRVFFAFSFGPFLGFWTAFEAAAQRGCLCVPGGGLSSSARLKMIADNGITVLCCTPTYALRLGEVAREEGLTAAAATVRTLLVAGEPGGGIPETRAKIAAAWPQARLFDHHGMTEVGPVSVQDDPEILRLRVIERAYVAEVIDTVTGAAVAPGSGGVGELVLSTLGRAGSPLLRYRTGDLVKPVFTAEGWLALEGGILGRVDDMAIVRGVNVYPSAVESVLRRFDGVAEYRVTIRQAGALAEMSVEIEPAGSGGSPAELAHRVEQALRDAFNLRVPVAAVAAGVLPRFELKSRRWVRA